MKPEEMAALPTAAVDLPAALVILWLGYGKFYSLFSLLFGIGFALQLESAARDGDQRLRRFRRRLLVLLAIGFVHLTFIWEGDILALYALVGFALIPLRRLSQRALIVTAAVLLVLPVVEQALIVASHGALDPGAPLLEIGGRWQTAMGFARRRHAVPGAQVREPDRGRALSDLSGIWFRYADLLTTGRPFKVLAMFVLGLWVGRSGMLRDIEPWVPLLRRVRLVGLARWSAGRARAGADGVRPRRQTRRGASLGAAAYALGVAPLALAYASHLALLWRGPSGATGCRGRSRPAGWPLPTT